MDLVFLTHRISNPVTGGEIYNDVLLKVAESTGLKTINWEGDTYGRAKKSFLFMNLVFLFKTIYAKPDTIFLYDTDYHARYFVSLLWARYIRKAKCVAMLHHFNHLCRKPSLMRTIQKGIETIVARQFTHLIVNTPFSYRCFTELSNRIIPTYQLEPFTNTNFDKFYSPKTSIKTPLMILCVGTVEARKNIDQLIRACSKLSVPYILHIVGKQYHPDYLELLEDIMNECGNKEYIQFHGLVSNEQIITFFEKADIFCMISRMEGYGMVYAEAMRFGLPIVASTMGAVPDLVENGVNGILCDPENSVQISTAIEEIIKPETYSKISKNNIERALTLVNRSSFSENAKIIIDEIKNN